MPLKLELLLLVRLTNATRSIALEPPGQLDSLVSECNQREFHSRVSEDGIMNNGKIMVGIGLSEEVVILSQP